MPRSVAARPPRALALALIALLAVALGPARAGAQPSFATRLPIVVIDADGPIVDEPKVGAAMRIIHRAGRLNRPGDPANVYRGRIEIEVRGQSSQRFPKKQFSLDTVDARGENRNVPLLGMPAENDWVLYAAYNDGTLMRNVVAYRAARRLGGYAARTRYVELVLNGRYWGVYVLMESLKLDGERVASPGEDSDGWLLEYTTTGKLDAGDTWFRTPVTRTPIVYADPERDEMSPAQARAIAARVARFERTLYGRGYRHPTRGYRAQLDLPAAVDYALLYELFRNHDAFSASTYMHEGRGGLIAMGPLWDFDLSMGNPPALLPPRGCSLCDRRWVSRWYDDPAFVAAMRARWTELRRRGFVRRMIADIERDARALAPAQVRNLRRWPVLGYRPLPAGAPEPALRAAYRAETARLTAWLRIRSSWLTANLPRIGRL
ncbi:MAG TPA: CotH kinase family protein [Miltoncostaeaceae bacterium]|nr:CotH kinase family protein [Miltoncostaeaceae bacterium]